MVREYIVNQVKDISNIDCESGIVIGDEGCIYRLIHNDILEMAKEAGKRKINVRLLTPFVPDKYMEQAYNQIEKISNVCKLKVTFNDYGLLHRCKKIIESGNIIPVAGRILTRSIIDCPWYSKLLTHENEELKDAIVGSNYYHSSKWDTIKKCGINELEINTIEDKYDDEIEKSGFDTTYHADNNIISVGRVCFAARWYKLELPKCCESPKCQSKISIDLYKKWSKKIHMCEEADMSIKKYYDHMYLQGNVVYCELDKNHKNSMKCNRVIV